MKLTIPPIRNAEDRIDAIGVLLQSCDTDQLADIAYGILEGRFTDLPDAFADVFNDAREALDCACATWSDRHEPDDEIEAHRSFGWEHPDSPHFGI